MKTTIKTILAMCVVLATTMACKDQHKTILPQKSISVVPEPTEPLLPSDDIVKPRLKVPVSELPSTNGKSIMIVNPKPTVEILAPTVEPVEAEVPRDN